MSEPSPWNDVLAPFYAESGLHKHGIASTEGLIGLKVGDETVVYPHAQFEVADDGSLSRREKVLELWNTMIRPAIEEGVVDEWTATGLLLQETEEHPSEAELIARDPAQVERVATRIAETLHAMRQ